MSKHIFRATLTLSLAVVLFLCCQGPMLKAATGSLGCISQSARIGYYPSSASGWWVYLDTTTTTVKLRISTANDSDMTVYYSCNGGSEQSFTADDGSKTIGTGLQPNRCYSDYFYKIGTSRSDDYASDNHYCTFYTAVASPSNPVFSSIRDNQVTVSWSKGANYTDPTSYTLYRAVSLDGPWTIRYTGSLTSFVDSGVEAETTYYYYVECTGYQDSYNLSSTVSVTTSAEPAVAAANAAKGAAEAAMSASEAAKSASIGAEQAVAEMSLRLTGLENTIRGLQADFQSPEVSAVWNIPKMATKNSQENIFIECSDNKSSPDNIKTRVLLNGQVCEDWGVRTSCCINFPSIGLYSVTVEAQDEAGNLNSASVNIWKL